MVKFPGKPHRLIETIGPPGVPRSYDLMQVFNYQRTRGYLLIHLKSWWPIFSITRMTVTKTVNTLVDDSTLSIHSNLSNGRTLPSPKFFFLRSIVLSSHPTVFSPTSYLIENDNTMERYVFVKRVYLGFTSLCDWPHQWITLTLTPPQQLSLLEKWSPFTEVWINCFWQFNKTKEEVRTFCVWWNNINIPPVDNLESQCHYSYRTRLKIDVVKCEGIHWSPRDQRTHSGKTPSLVTHMTTSLMGWSC